MSEYQHQQPTVVQRDNWFARNWKWLVPAGCLLLILGLASFAGGILMLAYGSFKQSTPYSDALRRAQANPEVVAAFGEPIEAGMMMGGSIKLENDDGTADFTVPLSGPKGKGKLHVVGTKTDGEWSYGRLVAVLPDHREVDLLASTRPVPIEPAEPEAP
ncbi:MAG TPA: cytochrome c oxidase assembly factor Coa1 family protein [Thermoanaerobaculia bacterium]